MHPILKNLPDGNDIPVDSLKKALINCISPGDALALREGQGGLVISEDNRLLLLGLLDDPISRTGTVPREEIAALIDALTRFLERHMPEQPEGHLWIVLSCVYLSMVLREPMHPQRFTHWRLEGETYRCPAREETPGSVCLWCVCKVTTE